MAVKKPIYRYQYKPTAATYFKPALSEKEQLAKSVGTQVTNLESRFENVGVPTETGNKEADQRNIIEKALNLKANQNTLMDILEVMNRPTQVVTNILSSLGDKDKRNVLSAAWEGLSGQKEIGARQALVNLTGDKNILKFEERKGTKVDDIAQFVVDFGLEVIADPTTWITLGTSAVAKAGTKAAKEASEALFKKAATMSDDVLLGAMGGVDDILDPAAASGFYEGFIKNPDKIALLKKANDLLIPKKTLGQKFISKLDTNVKAWTRKAIFALPPDKARAAVSGLRSLRNFTEKTKGAFNALKDIGAGLRGKLDKVFGKANAKLDLLKVGVKKLDDQLDNLGNKLVPSLDQASGVKRKAYRDAAEELYEAGVKIDPTGANIKAGRLDLPTNRALGKDIIKDIGDPKKNNAFISRKISVNNTRAIRDAKAFAQQVNENVGEGLLKAEYVANSTKDGFIRISLDLSDNALSTVTKKLTGKATRKAVGKYRLLERLAGGAGDTPLTQAAKEAAMNSLAEKYGKAIAQVAKETGAGVAFQTGKVVLSDEALELLAKNQGELSEIYKTYETVLKQADDLMGTSVDGVKYNVESLVQGKKELAEQNMRYVRRIRTKEYLKELSDKGMFEANPMIKEIVSGTGRELNERLYRGTTKEYNDVLRTFFNATDDRFSQDLVESAIDYIRVADSRFSMTEVTRLIFGLDVEQGYDFKKVKGGGGTLVKNLPKEAQEAALARGLDKLETVQWNPAGKFKQNADWAQDSQFLKPVDEMITGDVKKFDKKALPKDNVSNLKVQRSDIVTKEMAADFKRRYPNHKILDDGFIHLEGDKVVGGEFKSLYDSLPKDLQGMVLQYLKDAGMVGKKMAIHTSAYNILKNAQNAYKVNLGVGIKFFDKFLNFWKGATLLSPAFHVRNAFGNWMNMSLAGLNPLEITRYTKEAWQEVVKRDEILKKIAAGTASAADEVALASSNTYVAGLASARRGVRDLENLAELRKYTPDSVNKKLGSGIKGKYDELVQANFKLAERADEVQRLAMFKALKNKGFTDEQAIQRVREVLFDYGKLTGFEKETMKRFFPFYTFMKENFQFQFKNMLQNSGRYKNLFRGYKHYLEEVGDIPAEDMPDYMTGNMWVPLPFTFNKDDTEAISMLKLNLPASDFLEFVEQPLKKGASSIAVPIKMTWEFMTGVDTFTGAPIQKYPGERSLMKEGDSLFKFLRNEKGEFDVSKNPIIKKLADDLGLRTLRKPLTAILDGIDTIFGKQDVATGVFDILEQTGITTTVKKEDLNLTALYQQLEYLRNLKKLYEQNTGEALPSQREAAGYQYKPK
jgi:hypothetical protein